MGVLTNLQKPNVADKLQQRGIAVSGPSDIFYMVTHHSKFLVAIRGGETTLALVRLLHTCIKSTSGTITMERELWGNIFSVFNAGLGELDTAIRKLISVSMYSENDVSSNFWRRLYSMLCARELSHQPS